MIISESRLRQIVLEEVQLRLLEHYIEEALKDLDVDEDDPDYEKYKKMSRRALFKKLGTWGAGAAAMAALGGGIRAGEKDIEHGIASRRATHEKERADYKASDQYIVDELDGVLSRPSNFSWVWGEERGEMQTEPGSTSVSLPQDFPILLDKDHGTIGVLSPEYGVYRAVQEDFNDQVDKETKIPRLEETDTISGEGSAEKWKQEFPDTYGLPRTPDYVGAGNKGVFQKAINAGFKSDVGISRQYKAMIYLPLNEIPPTMVMPNSHMTPSEFYVHLWDKYALNRLKR